MSVEWDERKRLANLDDHGVDFQDAALVFLSRTVEAADNRAEYGEQRFRALGRVGDEYFMVAYTWRGLNRRIISAWKVDDEGRRRYEAVLTRSP